MCALVVTSVSALMVTSVSELVVTGVSELVVPALLSRRVLTPRKQAQAQSVIPSKNQQKHLTWFKRLLPSQVLRALSRRSTNDG